MINGINDASKNGGPISVDISHIFTLLSINDSNFRSLPEAWIYFFHALFLRLDWTRCSGILFIFFLHSQILLLKIFVLPWDVRRIYSTFYFLHILKEYDFVVDEHPIRLEHILDSITGPDIVPADLLGTGLQRFEQILSRLEVSIHFSVLLDHIPIAAFKLIGQDTSFELFLIDSLHVNIQLFSLCSIPAYGIVIQFLLSNWCFYYW